MERLEIIAKLKKLGHINENREQEIELEEVAELGGDYNLVGEVVKIYICDASTSKIVDSALEKYRG